MPLTFKNTLASITPATNIFVVNEASKNDEGISRLIYGMAKQHCYFYQTSKKGVLQNPLGLIAKDDTVMIKVNSQWDQRGGPNTDLLKSFIKTVTSHPDGFVGEIVVVDNGQAQYGSAGKGGSLDWGLSNARDTAQSVQKVVDSFKDFKVSTYLWDIITEIQVKEYDENDASDGYIVDTQAKVATNFMVSYPKFTTKFGTRISFKKGLWNPETRCYNDEKLKLINWPTLKSHFIYGVTGCVKSYMGIVTDKLTAKLGARSHDKVWQGVMGNEISETRMPVLNIVDAIWVNAKPAGGPWTPYDAAQWGDILLAGTDPVALDYFGAKHILMPLAREAGHIDLSSIDPDNTTEKNFGHWMRLASLRLCTSGFNTTFDEQQMNVVVVE
jgi:hypothetical protein